MEKVPSVTPNIVPATFTPVPEQFAPAVTQELRSKQAHWAQGYTLNRVSHLENQLRTAHYKRALYTIDQGYTEAQSEALIKEDIKVAKTAKTIMLDRISEWAGNAEEDYFNSNVLPKAWARFVEEVKGIPAPEPAEETEPVPVTVEEEPLALEDMEPVVVVDRPYVSIHAPKSEVVAPEQVSLGEVLGKIESKK